MEYSVDHFMFKMIDEMFVALKSYIGKPINHLYIPKSVCISNKQYYIQSILPHAFYQMTINTIDLRDTICLKCIQEQAFDECVIHKIYLPSSVSKIGHTAFSSSITYEVFIEPGSIHFCNCESKFLQRHPYIIIRAFDSLSSSFIRKTTHALWAGAYQHNLNIFHIAFPFSVQFIGNNAFRGCSNLQSIFFSSTSSCKHIGEYAFAETQISIFCFPLLVQRISEGVFYNSSLENLRFPKFNHCTFICEKAFMCTKIKELIIPRYVEHICSKAFANSMIEKVNIKCNFINFISNDAFIGNPIHLIISGGETIPKIQKCQLPQSVIYLSEEELQMDKLVEKPDGIQEIYPAQFTTSAKCICCVSRKNIDMRKSIRQPDNRADRISFECAENGCPFKLRYVLSHDTWIRVEFIPHSGCNPSRVAPLMNHLRHVVHKYYIPGFNCTSEFVDKVSQKVGCRVTHKRVQYHMKYIQGDLNKIQKWSDLITIADKIKTEGGNQSIIFEDGSKIKFISVIPNYSVEFLQSSAFFPLLIGDGTHCHSISKGVYIIFIALTGNHEILPIAWGWGRTESSENITNVLKLMIPNIKCKISFITDKGTAFESAINALTIEMEHFHCTWHLSDKLSAEIRSLLHKTMQEEDLCSVITDLKIIQEKFPQEYSKKIEPELNSYIKLLSNSPRFGYTTSQASESLNAALTSLRHQEPDSVFIHLYYLGSKIVSNLQGYAFIHGRLTPYANALIDKSIAKADRLITRTIMIDYKYQVMDPTKNNICFDVIINDQKKAIRCSCQKFFERGLVCSHILSAIKVHSKQIDILDLVHDTYKCLSYRNIWKNTESILSFRSSSQIPAFPPIITDRRKGHRKRIKPIIEIEREKTKKLKSPTI